jgi:DNA-binding NarL/FixJ family response regulator
MPESISIMLVDDHTIVRNGLRSLIEVMGNYKVIAEYDNGLQFINAISLLPDPDIVIIDLNMPEMNGVETVRWLRKHRPLLKILILTLDSEEKTIIELFRMGVRGYLPKNCTADVLKKAIEDTIQTGYYHSELLQHALTSDAERTEHLTSIMDRITDRELLFLKLICDEKEYTYDQIKDIMNVHRRTVDGYREALFERFNIKSKTGLVLFAIKHGVIKL